MKKARYVKFGSISIIGTVGVPANYGGFETLVENLVAYNNTHSLAENLTVYCSSKAYSEKISTYLGSKIRYIPLRANGVQSIPYDMWSLFSATWNRSDVILLLGVSGAVALPLVRLFSSARIITNIDGIEWRRKKWKGLAKLYLRLCEKIAVKFSDEVISDNKIIAEYVKQKYSVDSHVITYGGDHALAVNAAPFGTCELPEKYAFSVCRIEPENNVDLILEAFSRQHEIPLVLIGNWSNSKFGLELRERYATSGNLYLIDPIYDLGILKTFRTNCVLYIHGHSAGGTNPSLVEAMHFGRPIFAYDCNFNRATTENKAQYFASVDDLLKLIQNSSRLGLRTCAEDLLEIAKRRYTWDVVAREYFTLIDRC